MKKLGFGFMRLPVLDANDASNPTIDSITKTGRTNYDFGSNLIIAQAVPDNLELSIETGYSAHSSNPTKYFCYTQKGTGNIMYNTVLYPTKTGTSSDISVKNIDTGVDPTVASAMDINLFKDNDDVLNVFYYNSFEETPSERNFAGYNTNSSNVTIEQDVDGIPQFLSMYNGSFVTKEDRELISSDVILGDIEVQYDGRNAKITSKDENITDAKLTILAPYKIDKVTINGAESDFIYSDGMIYINNDELVDFSLDAGYVVRLTAIDDEANSFPVLADIPASCVKSGSLAMP